jgi:hypothetical protein
MADPTLFLSRHHLNSTQQNYNYIFRKKSNNTSQCKSVQNIFQKPTLSMLGLAIHQVQRKRQNPPLLILWAVIRNMKVIQHVIRIKHFYDNLIEITCIYTGIHCKFLKKKNSRKIPNFLQPPLHNNKKLAIC